MTSFIMPIVDQVIDVAHEPLVIFLINLDANVCCINKKCLIVLAKLKKKQTSNVQITKFEDIEFENDVIDIASTNGGNIMCSL